MNGIITGLGIITALSITGAIVQTHRLNSLDNKYDELGQVNVVLTHNLAESMQTTSTLRQKIAMQNNAIDNMAADQKKKAEEYAKVKKQQEQEIHKEKQEIIKLTQRQGSTCEDANELINEEIK